MTAIKIRMVITKIIQMRENEAGGGAADDDNQGRIQDFCLEGVHH